MKFEEDAEVGGTGTASPDSFSVRDPDMKDIDLTLLQNTSVTLTKEDLSMSVCMYISLSTRRDSFFKKQLIYFWFSTFTSKRL